MLRTWGTAARIVPIMPVSALLLTLTMLSGGVRADGATPDGAAAHGAWRLAVLDNGALRELGGRGASIEPVSYTASAARPSSDSAAWSLQLGIVPPNVGLHRAGFGPGGGIPIAGDFNGDGFAELGVFVDGRWYLDLNANNTWDDGDLVASLGGPGDLPVVGDWNQDGKADLGVYSPAFANEIAVVGDWDGTGVDRIGVFRDGRWHLDADGDGRLTSGDPVVQFGAAGDRPIVGDFNRDGRDELGVYRRGQWTIDVNHDYRLGAGDLSYACGTTGDAPVVGDWDGDGRDQIGLMHR